MYDTKKKHHCNFFAIELQYTILGLKLNALIEEHTRWQARKKLAKSLLK